MRSCRSIALGFTAGVVMLGSSSVVSAHTEIDVVAVPAGGEAAVTFRPQHGCGDSPTLAVLVRAPMADAVAEPVDGWQSTSTPDGNGNTVLEWSGGSLPADLPGAFPIEFVAPDTVGELLTFPAVQRCENGDELAWISGDPADEYPAPRLLILAAGSAPAATIDDVALDAPGRDQLVAIVDVDNPAATTTTVAPAAETTVASTAEITVPESASASSATTASGPDESIPTAPTATEPSVAASVVGDAASSQSGGGSSAVGWVIAAVVLGAAVGAGVIVWRRRAAS